MRLLKKLSFMTMGFLAMASLSLVFAHSAHAATTNGRIIDDAVFDASGSMSAADIQNFFNQFPNSCVKNYTDSMPSADPTQAYFNYSGTGTVAQIIRRIADVYGINPRVLITKLEQEENLVTGNAGCASWRLASAIGFHCYDGANPRTTTFNGQTIQTCVDSDANMGPARQLTKGAWTLKWAKERANGNLSWMVPDDASIYYYGPMTQGNRKRCGACSTVYFDGYWNGVYLETGATAALYNYTPYLGQAFGSIWEGWWGAGSTYAVRTNWKFEQLDGSPNAVSSYPANVGPFPTSAILNNEQYVFYYDVSAGDLRMAHEDSVAGWQFQTLDGSSTTGGQVNARVGWRPTATIYNGSIHVFYYDVDSGNLRHTWSDAAGLNWQYETLDGNGGAAGRLDTNLGQGPSVAIQSGILHVFYYDVADKNLRHARWIPAQRAWAFETLDGSAMGISRFSSDVGYESTATAFGTTIQVFYYDAQNGNLRHAWDDGVYGWRFENLDGDPGAIGRYNSNLGRTPVVMNYNNNLQLFYYDAQQGNLRHAWTTPLGWRFENLEGDPGSVSRLNSDVGIYPSVAEYQSTLQVFYHDAARGVLRHAFAGPSGWNFEDFDGNSRSLAVNTANVGLNSTVMPFGNTLQVYYLDASNGNLKHAWFVP